MDAQDRVNRDTFEDLWLLRACYPFRSDYDACSALSVADTIAYGERLMHAMHYREYWGGYGQRHRAV